MGPTNCHYIKRLFDVGKVKMGTQELSSEEQAVLSVYVSKETTDHKSVTVSKKRLAERAVSQRKRQRKILRS